MRDTRTHLFVIRECIVQEDHPGQDDDANDGRAREEGRVLEDGAE